MIKSYIDFYLENIKNIKDTDTAKFTRYIKNELFDINNNQNSLKALINISETNIVRYKELLLFNFISKNNIQKIAELLDSGVDINCKIEDNISALHIAVSLEKEKIVELLLRHGADVEAITNTKLTPLMDASKRGFVEIVKLLIHNGANINAIGVDGNDALILATNSQKYEVVSLLLSYNIQLNQTNNEKDNALTRAIKMKDIAMTKLILPYAPNIHSQEYITFTQDNEISNEIKNELEKFETDPIYYILKRSNNLKQIDIAFSNLKSYEDSEPYATYLNELQLFLWLNFSYNRSYKNFLDTSLESAGNIEEYLCYIY